MKTWLLGFIASICLQGTWALAQGTAPSIASTSKVSAQTGPLYLSYEQRILVSYALLAQGKEAEAQEQVFERFTNFAKRLHAKGVQTVQVKNFAEFLAAYRGDWPNTNSLDLDLEIIEKRAERGFPRFVSKSERVQKQIDQFIESQNNGLVEAAKAADGNQKSVREMGQKALSSLMEAFVTQNGAVSKAAVREILKISDTLIASRVNELNHIGEKIAQSKMAAEKDPSTKIALETIFTEYFAGLGSDSKKLLISSFLGADLRANDIQKFELMVQNSGPQLQKLLQVVARQGGLDKEMSSMFRKLESSVRSVPWVQVESLLANEKTNYNFTYFERKPLGVGSMAQVHRAKILVNGERKDVVVRFIKPGMAQRVQEDHLILQKIAHILDNHPQMQNLGIPKMSPMVEDITRTVAEELNQDQTIKHQLAAEKVYEKEIAFSTNGYKNSLKIHVPDIYVAGGKSEFMVQEMVFGQKLDKEAKAYEALLPDFKKVVVEKMASMWLQEVLFGSGFYHADLHQGNFLVQIKEPSPSLTILDYGMTGQLSKELQAQVIVLGAGFQALDPQLIFEAFWKISNLDKNTIDPELFRKRVEAKVKQIKLGREVNPSMDIWVAWAMEQGIHPSYEFVNLNRGIAIVSKMLTESGSVETIETITERLAKSNPGMMFRALTKDGGLGLKGITKLGASQFKKTTSFNPAAVRCEGVFQ